MVQLTRAAAVRATPVLSKAEDLMGRRYGRLNIQEKDVPLNEKLPLSLKNILSNKSTKDGQKACMDQMMSVIACLGKFDQNQAMCSAEIASFQKCFADFKSTQSKNKKFRESGKLPLGQYAKMTGPQLNTYMKGFMQSSRTGQALPDSTFRKKSR